MTPFEFIQDFYTRHRAELQALPRYKKDYADRLTLLPDFKSGLKTEDIPVFNQAVDEFLERFILPYKANIKVDLKGHLPAVDGLTLEEVDNAFRDNFLCRDLSVERIRRLLLIRLAVCMSSAIVLSRDRIAESGIFEGDCVYIDDLTCPECGDSVHCEYDFKRKVICVPEYMDDMVPECPAKETDGKVSFTVQVPSGQLVFANDVHWMFEKDRDACDSYKCSIENRLGKMELTQKIGEETNLIWAWIGDADPHLVERKSDGQIFAVDPELFAGYISKECNFNTNIDGIQYEPEYHLYDSLFRAVCAVDKDVFFKRQKDLGEECKEYFVIDLKGKTEVVVEYDTNIDAPWHVRISAK